ncbi:MAG: hypothetical protein ACN4E2_04135 [Nitrospinota bacterium]
MIAILIIALLFGSLVISHAKRNFIIAALQTELGQLETTNNSIIQKKSALEKLQEENRNLKNKLQAISMKEGLRLNFEKQFRCVAESTITRTLWELSVTTSGSFKESDFHSFARMVGADLIIANRVVQDGDNVDILSVTHSSLEPITKKNRAWWRLKIPMNQLDIEDGDFGTIVLPNRKSARSKLDLKISRYPNVQDIDLDMVTVVPINDQITASRS